jgi:hypothetical protein
MVWFSRKQRQDSVMHKVDQVQDQVDQVAAAAVAV